MAQITNREIHLKSRPVGLPTTENFEIVHTPLPDVGAKEKCWCVTHTCPLIRICVGVWSIGRVTRRHSNWTRP